MDLANISNIRYNQFVEENFLFSLKHSSFSKKPGLLEVSFQAPSVAYSLLLITVLGIG